MMDELLNCADGTDLFKHIQQELNCPTSHKLTRNTERLCRRCATCAGAPGAALRTLAAQTVSAREDGDAAEAAGFGDRRSQCAVGAVRVRAAPRAGLQALHVAVGAALPTAGRPTGALPVAPADGRRTGQTELCEHRHKHKRHTHTHADPSQELYTHSAARYQTQTR